MELQRVDHKKKTSISKTQLIKRKCSDVSSVLYLWPSFLTSTKSRACFTNREHMYTMGRHINWKSKWAKKLTGLANVGIRISYSYRLQRLDPNACVTCIFYYFRLMRLGSDNALVSDLLYRHMRINSNNTF